MQRPKEGKGNVRVAAARDLCFGKGISSRSNTINLSSGVDIRELDQTRKYKCAAWQAVALPI